MPPRYLDFKLTLAGTPSQYTVAAQGPRGINIDPLPTQLDLPAVREAVLELQDGLTLEPVALERLGAALFDVLFPRKIARAFERAYEDLETGTELRLKLSLLQPDLTDLPWELLYDPDVGAFLAARATMPIVRMIESGTPSASLLARRPLRVLQVQASPKDEASLDLAGSEVAIRAGLASSGEVTVLRNATPAALQAALRQGQFHVLHVDGHGYFDVEANAGYLYGFIHLTFEEYLAGAGIALLGQQAVEPIVEAIALHVGDPAWREVALLAIGYLGVVQQREEAAGAVVEALVKEQPGPPGEAVVLAGEAVQDAGAGGVPAVSRERVVAALVETMQASGVPAVLRRRAGLALGRLVWLPNDLDEFVEVPAGEFLYGERKKRTRIPYTYWIARYPVTNAQFARFMADGGYARRELWSEEGWSWRVGSYVSKADDRWKDMLARRPVENRDRPFWWDEAERANPIFPVVGVNWFEAEAYANWLNSRLDALRVAGQGTVSRPTGYVVCLAGVVEWERAARGVDGREYPWGDAYSAEFANTEESDPRTEKHPVRGIGTTAVCTYPQGVSPIGAWDTSGNVWEWTRSPVVERQPRMVVRGGACYSERTLVRCAHQERGGPDLDLFFDHIGLRVVLSLADSES